MNGYIKLWRPMMEWEWYKSPVVKSVFIHLLFLANIEDARWKGVDIKRGQLITSLDSISVATGLSVQQVRTALNKLKSTSEITIKSTNQYSLITVDNWGLYQSSSTTSTSDSTDDSTNEQQTDNKRITNEQQTDNKRITTDREYKKKEKGKKKEEEEETNGQIPIEWASFSSELIEALNGFISFRKSIKKPMSENAVKLLVKKLNGFANNDSDKIEILNQSVVGGWTGIYEIKGSTGYQNGAHKQSEAERIMNL